MSTPEPAPPTLDARLNGPAERDRIEQVARLYLVVQGRPPDRGGLEAYSAVMSAGKSLHDLAVDFLASAEFNARPGAITDPAGLLALQALGPGQPPPPHRSLPDLVCTLVLSPLVAERHPLLPALFPDGVRLEHPVDYRIWLATRRPVLNAAPPFPLSFILPIEDPSAPWPRDTINSVLGQNLQASPPGPAPGLELLIAARRFDPHARVLALEDPRVRLVQLSFWPSRARLFNTALARATGLFTALLGPRDRLDPDAASRIATIPDTEADIILSDDDALDGAGLRHSPRLGDAWDPDRMLATGHPGLLLARTALLQKAGGMRPRQPRPDWDLLLRASLLTTPARIRHIPAVLLSRGNSAPRATRKDEPAARAYLHATAQPGATVAAEHGRLRITYPIPAKPPRASIVIATRDRAELLARCTEGLLHRTGYPDLELVLVDNGSTDPAATTLLSRLATDTRVTIVSSPGPFNWPALNNLGVSRMHGEVAVLLNNDTDVLSPDWLLELVSHAIRPGIGAVGAKLLYPDGAVQHAGMVLGRDGNAIHMWRHSPGDAPGYLDSLAMTREVTALTGACLALRRDLYEAVGGCDAEALPITWNDVDLCLRLRARGLRNIWTPHACLMHLEQATRGPDGDEMNQARYKREQALLRHRWGPAFTTDPFLNRNLLPSERHPLLATDV